MALSFKNNFNDFDTFNFCGFLKLNILDNKLHIFNDM